MTAQTNQQRQFAPRLCPICNKPVDLKTAKTDERGKAIHEDCYKLKIDFERAAGRPGSTGFGPGGQQER